MWMFLSILHWNALSCPRYLFTMFIAEITVINEVKIHDLPIPIAAVKTPSTTIVSITEKI